MYRMQHKDDTGVIAGNTPKRRGNNQCKRRMEKKKRGFYRAASGASHICHAGNRASVATRQGKRVVQGHGRKFRGRKDLPKGISYNVSVQGGIQYEGQRNSKSQWSVNEGNWREKEQCNMGYTVNNAYFALGRNTWCPILLDK